MKNLFKTWYVHLARGRVSYQRHLGLEAILVINLNIINYLKFSFFALGMFDTWGKGIFNHSVFGCLDSDVQIQKYKVV